MAGPAYGHYGMVPDLSDNGLRRRSRLDCLLRNRPYGPLMGWALLLWLTAASDTSSSAFHEPERRRAGFAATDINAHQLDRLVLQALHEGNRRSELGLLAIEGIV